MFTILLALIPWEQKKLLDALLPKSITVPSGSNILIDYEDIEKPKISVKIQELFGMSETPKILNNTIAVQIHLLSPALRPIQITYDLKSFWDSGYDEVRKELRGKYKKHYWPQNPYEAIATNKTKKNMDKV
jgi:ATP-dependent helicase HrpB